MSTVVPELLMSGAMKTRSGTQLTPSNNNKRLKKAEYLHAQEFQMNQSVATTGPIMFTDPVTSHAVRVGPIDRFLRPKNFEFDYGQDNIFSDNNFRLSDTCGVPSEPGTGMEEKLTQMRIAANRQRAIELAKKKQQETQKEQSGGDIHQQHNLSLEQRVRILEGKVAAMQAYIKRKLPVV